MRNDAVAVDIPWEELIRAASDPTTPPQQLKGIANEVMRYRSEPDARWEELGESVARHPNTPPETLRNLAWKFNRAVLANPILPLLVLEDPGFAHRFEAPTLMRMLRHVEVPVPFVAACRSHPRAEVAQAARWHIAVAGEADPTDEGWQREVIDVVTHFPVTSVAELFDLVETDAAPRAFLERIGLAAVHEPELPEETVQFRRRQCRRDRERARRRAQRALGKAPSVEEPEGGWGKLAERDVKTLLDLALDPDLPHDAMRVLAQLPNVHSKLKERLRLHLSRNLATPTDVLEQIVRYNTAARIAAHPNTTSALLETVVDKYRHLPALAEVAYSPKSPPELLERLLAEHSREPFVGDGAQIRRLVRWNPNYAGRRWVSPLENTPISTRRYLHMLGGLVQFVVSTAFPLMVETYQDSAESELWYVRLGAALNSHTPPNLRQTLTDDSHRLVRAAARARLADSTAPLSILGL